MSVVLTEKAAKEIKRVIEEQELAGDVALRVGVVGGGCKGFEYQLGFEESVNDERDTVNEMHGIRVAVDQDSLEHLQGTEVDFYTGLEKRGFTFSNPNATRSCGCGNSFSASCGTGEPSPCS
jgi:iron-sulfur cluster assembly protein